ncbi:hypothetical protein [Acaryochloris sp. IP29b_bin.148]|uniref:hypothetical protein n=1 Tax=Acaryochloris sp. IP29b_bin.148 TaxID=2969218 RepID=UPI00262F418D|nr:hypothetical protein [Acaryochloris sp. IP29b_bin.148]
MHKLLPVSVVATALATFPLLLEPQAALADCNTFGCSKSSVAECNPFGCPNPPAGEACTPFGCPASPRETNSAQGNPNETAEEKSDRILACMEKLMGEGISEDAAATACSG